MRNVDEIFEIILEQNAIMLTRSREGMTATGSLQQAIGYHAENEEFITQLLEGKVDAEEHARQYPTCELEANAFITNMKKHVNGSMMKWKFGVDEYKNLFNHTREETSCGPSGLHMSHWKAATQSEELMMVHSTLT